MLPAVRRERRLGLHAQRIIEPAFRQPHLHVAFLEIDAVTLGVRRKGRVGRLLDHAGENRAPLRSLRLDPGGERELVEKAEVTDIAAMDEAPAVEHGGRRLPRSGSEGGIPVFKLRRRICPSGACEITGQFVPRSQAIRHRPGGHRRRGDVLLPRVLRGRDARLQFAQPLLGGVELRLEFGQRLLLHLGGRGHDWRRIADLDRPAVLGDVVEKGEELVKLALRDGVVFMVVTARATEGEPEPHGRGRVDSNT